MQESRQRLLLCHWAELSQQRSFLPAASFSHSPLLFAQEMDRQLLQLGDLAHHAPVLLAWALLRHTISPEEAAGTVRRLGSAAIQLGAFQHLTRLLRALSAAGTNVSFPLLLPGSGGRGVALIPACC